MLLLPLFSPLLFYKIKIANIFIWHLKCSCYYTHCIAINAVSLFTGSVIVLSHSSHTAINYLKKVGGDCVFPHIHRNTQCSVLQKKSFETLFFHASLHFRAWKWPNNCWTTSSEFTASFALIVSHLCPKSFAIFLLLFWLKIVTDVTV